MAADLRLIFWRIRLAYWLRKFGYSKRRWSALPTVWRHTGEECWTDYYHNDYSPRGAIDKDLSYGD